MGSVVERNPKEVGVTTVFELQPTAELICAHGEIADSNVGTVDTLQRGAQLALVKR